ncbi:MAG: hypothetical protein LBK26_01320 [Rickettsiales bacterium]|jgi:hypothetical protein|nr:hypothetical protein [Rickettsiales bacterium]
MSLKNKLTIFTVLAMGLFVPMSLCAWPLISNETIRSAWGAPGGSWNLFPTGGSHAEFCIGSTQSGSFGCQFLAGTYSDDQAALGVVARKITANGGYFCVTQLQCEGKHNPYTYNVEPNSGGWCDWLCKDGFSGEGCKPINASEYSLSAGNAACDQKTISRSGFSGSRLKTSGGVAGNIEYNVDILHNGRDGGKEKDVMVGISGWLENKRGAVASPLLFYCANAANSNQIGLNVFTNLAMHTLCLPGYTGPNCEKCKPSKMCDGFTTGFDPAKHIIQAGTNCSEFRCSDPTQGFKSATDRSCIECTNISNQYYTDNNGVCNKCSGHNVYDSVTKQCKNVLALTKDQLRYGISSPSTELCWMKAEPKEYECCVRNKTWNTTAKTCS